MERLENRTRQQKTKQQEHAGAAIAMAFLAVFMFAIGAVILLIPTPAFAAWTEPSASPPSGNVAAPLNVSAIPQTKAGPLTALAPESSTPGATTWGINGVGAKAVGDSTSAGVYGISSSGGTGQLVGLLGVAGANSANSVGVYGWDNNSGNAYAGYFLGKLGISGKICLNGTDAAHCISDWGNITGQNIFTWDSNNKIIQPDTSYQDSSFAIGGTTSANAAFYVQIDPGPPSRSTVYSTGSLVLGEPMGGSTGDGICTFDERCTSEDCFGKPATQCAPGDICKIVEVESDSCEDKAAPTIPSNLVLASTLTTVSITWDASVDVGSSGLKQYRIYRCKGMLCTPSVQVGTSATPSFQDIGLDSGTYYTYTIAAEDNQGNVSSASAAVTVMTQTDTTPAAPSGVAVQGRSDTSVTLVWAKNTEADLAGYRLFQCTDATGASCLLKVDALAPSETPSVTVSDLTEGATYYFQVRAYDAADPTSLESVGNTVIAATTTTTAPSAPENLRETSKTDISVSLAWDKNTTDTNVEGYRVFRCADQNCATSQQVGTDIGANGPYVTTDTGRASSTTYYYQAATFDTQASESTHAPTPSLAVTTLDDTTPPAEPAGLTAIEILDVSITLRWNASADPESGTTQYKLYRCTGSSCTPNVVVATVPHDAGANPPTYSVDNGARASTTYRYSVSAVNSVSLESSHATFLTVTSAEDGGGLPVGASGSPNRGFAQRVEKPLVEGIRPLARLLSAPVTQAAVKKVGPIEIPVARAAEGRVAAAIQEVKAASTESPRIRLTINNGGLRLVSSSAPTNPLAGTMYFDGTAFKCTTNGTDWTDCGGGIGAGSITATPPITLTGTTPVNIALTTPLANQYGGTGTTTEFTKGSLVFAGDNGVYSQDDSNLFWDAATNKLGIGKVPGVTLDVLGADGNGTIAKFARGGLEKPLYISSVWNTDSYISSEGNLRLRTNVPAGNPLGTGAVEAVMIDTSGNVGIGTPSPGALLDVASTSVPVLRVLDTEGAGPQIKLQTGPNIYTIIGNGGGGTGGGIKFVQQGVTGSEVVFTGDGNVGIGKAPDVAYMLDVNGAINVPGGSEKGICFNGSCAKDWPALIENSDPNNGGFEVGTGQAASFNITGSGNINTDLTVSGRFGLNSKNANNRYTYFQATSTQDDNDITYQLPTTISGSANKVLSVTGVAGTTATLGWVPPSGGIGIDIGSGTPNRLAKFKDATTLQDSAVFESGGNVGIGAAADSQYKLAVLGGTTTSMLKLTNDYANLLFDIDSSSNAIINQWNNAPLVFKTNNAAAMTIVGSGNVGIGTTTPFYRTDVAGSLSSSLGYFVNSRPNLVISTTYYGADIVGWQALDGATITAVMAPDNGFRGAFLRLQSDGTYNSDRVWTVPSAMTTQFLANHQYRISFRYRAQSGFTIKNRDVPIATVSSNTGSATFFSTTYAPTSDCGFSSNCQFLVLLNSANNTVELENLFIEDLSTDAATNRFAADALGNVGIGTTAPAGKFVVNNNAVGTGSAGDAIAAYANSGNAALYAEQDGSGYAGYFSGFVKVKPNEFLRVFTQDASIPRWWDNTVEAQTTSGYFDAFSGNSPSTNLLYFGNPTPFNTVTFYLSRPATTGFGYAAEYSIAGASWKALTNTDTTTNLTKDGTITFSSPADWQQQVLNGSPSLFWVRLRLTTCGGCTRPYLNAVTPENSTARVSVLSESGDANPALYIGSLQRVGIGSSTPREALDIVGGFRVGQAPTLQNTLNNTITNTTTTIPVVNNPDGSFPYSGTIIIDNEAIAYGGLGTVPSNNSFNNATRGVFGTTAAAHNTIGAKVDNYVLVALANSATTPRFVVTGNGRAGVNVAVPTGQLTIQSAISPNVNLNHAVDVYDASNNGTGGFNAVAAYKGGGGNAFVNGSALYGEFSGSDCATGKTCSAVYGSDARNNANSYAGYFSGKVAIKGVGSGATVFTDPSHSNDITYTLPDAQAGAIGKVLKVKTVNGAAATLEWADDNGGGGGGVTSVSATAPVTSTGGVTPVIALNGLNGYGGANNVIGVVNAGGSLEYKSIVGVANETDVTNTAGQIQIGIIDPLSLIRGGTGANLSAVGAAGGIVYKSSASAMGISAAGASGDCLKSGGASGPTWGPCGSSGSYWSLAGNAATNPSTNYVGTSDTRDLVLKANNTEQLRLLSGGNTLLKNSLVGSTAEGATTAAVDAGGANLIHENSGFERGTDSGWGEQLSTTDCSYGITNAAANVYEGSYAVTIQSTKSSNGMCYLYGQPAWKVKSGRPVTFSVWAKASGATLPVPMVQFHLGLTGNAGSDYKNVPQAISTTWARYSFTVYPTSDTLTANEYHVFGVSFGTNTTTTVYLDAGQVEYGTLATPYKPAGQRLLAGDGILTTTPSGNVGIGQSSPNAVLTINDGNTNQGNVNDTVGIYGNNQPSSSALYVEQKGNGLAGYFSGSLEVVPNFNSNSVVSGLWLYPSFQTSLSAVGTYYGVRDVADVALPVGSSAINKLYGTFVGPSISGGTVNTFYGLYVQQPAVSGSGVLTNKYALITEAGAGNVGIGQASPNAKLVVNNPGVTDKTGSSGDAIYAFANNTNAAISAEQVNSGGYAGYFSGKVQIAGSHVVPSGQSGLSLVGTEIAPTFIENQDVYNTFTALKINPTWNTMGSTGRNIGLKVVSGDVDIDDGIVTINGSLKTRAVTYSANGGNTTLTSYDNNVLITGFDATIHNQFIELPPINKSVGQKFTICKQQASPPYGSEVRITPGNADSALISGHQYLYIYDITDTTYEYNCVTLVGFENTWVPVGDRQEYTLSDIASQF